MQRATKKLIKHLQAVVGDGNHADNDAWLIMTALRGPDFTSVLVKERHGPGAEEVSANAVKRATTAVIRQHLLPLSGEWSDFMSRPDSEESAELRRRLTTFLWHKPDHFISHAKHAFRVLGLSWTGVNEIAVEVPATSWWGKLWQRIKK